MLGYNKASFCHDLQLSLSEILQPAIQLAEEGFPVHPITANAWKNAQDTLKSWPKSFSDDLLIKGNAPDVGQIFKNPALAETLKVSLFLTDFKSLLSFYHKG